MRKTDVEMDEEGIPTMTRPKVTDDDLTRNFDLLRSDPEKYLELAEEFVRQNPDSRHAYFCRHQAWTHLGERELALADLDKALSLEQHHVTYRARGRLLRDMNRYDEAIEDFNKSEAMNPEAWLGGFGPLFRADCHARLGNPEAALADCATLRDDHWTPGVSGTPAGDKAEVTAEIRRLATSIRNASRRYDRG